MERLAHIIQFAVDNKEWKPIVLSRGGPQLSHLFFADDLLLFGDGTTKQMDVMIKCLNLFCAGSGEKVSIEKTKMLVSRNIKDCKARELRDISGFGLTRDLEKYLGSPFCMVENIKVTMTTLLRMLERDYLPGRSTISLLRVGPLLQNLF